MLADRQRTSGAHRQRYNDALSHASKLLLAILLPKKSQEPEEELMLMMS